MKSRHNKSWRTNRSEALLSLSIRPPFAPVGAHLSFDKEMKKRIPITIVLCIFCGSIGLVFASILKDGATLTIYNETSSQLSNVSVALAGGGTKDLGNIAAGKSSSARFQKYTDSSWFVTVDSGSGAQRITLDSYVTHGLNFDDRVSFHSGNRTSFESTSWSLFAPLRTIFGP